MKSFYVLSDDPTVTDSRYVVQQDTGDTDLRPFFRGVPVSPSILDNVRFFVNEGFSPDLLANPLGLLIASDKFVDSLKDAVQEEEVQFLTAPVFSLTTGNAVPGYSVVNPLCSLPALDHTVAKERILLKHLSISESRVPEGAGIFRLKEWVAFVLISEIVHSKLDAADLRRVLTRRVKTVQ